MDDQAALRPIADGLWETESHIKFAGVAMPARTVIVELDAGGLLIHSPGALDDGVREAVDKLGPVAALVAPNRFHHLFLDAWREAYPDAEVHVAPTLPKKRPALADAAVLGNEPPPLWQGEIDQHVWVGIPKIGEVVFFHRRTRTLLNTDMMHNMQSEERWFARTAWRMLGSYQRFGPSRLERWLTRDKPGLRASVDHILGWDFDRVTVAHGEVLESGGKDRVRDGWDWVPA